MLEGGLPEEVKKKGRGRKKKKKLSTDGEEQD